VFETPGVLGRSRRVGSVQDYRDRKLGARLEALCFVTLDVVLQAARNSLPTAAATIKGFEVMRMIRKGRCPMLEPGPTCEPAFPSCRLIGRNRRRTLRGSAASVTNGYHAMRAAMKPPSEPQSTLPVLPAASFQVIENALSQTTAGI